MSPCSMYVCGALCCVCSLNSSCSWHHTVIWIWSGKEGLLQINIVLKIYHQMSPLRTTGPATESLVKPLHLLKTRCCFSYFGHHSDTTDCSKSVALRTDPNQTLCSVHFTDCKILTFMWCQARDHWRTEWTSDLFMKAGFTLVLAMAVCCPGERLKPSCLRPTPVVIGLGSNFL